MVGGKLAARAAAAMAAAFCRVATSPARPRNTNPTASTVKAKTRAEALSTKSESSIPSMIRKVTNIRYRSHRASPNFPSVLHAPRLVAMAPTTPTA